MGLNSELPQKVAWWFTFATEGPVKASPAQASGEICRINKCLPGDLLGNSLSGPGDRDLNMNYHPDLAGIYGMSPLCAHRKDLHSPFISTGLRGLPLCATQHWGPLHAGLHQRALVMDLMGASILPAQPPLSPLSPLSSTSILKWQEDKIPSAAWVQRTCTQFPSAILFGFHLSVSWFQNVTMATSCHVLSCLPPSCRGTALFFRWLYLLFCFLWPLFSPVCSALDLRI